MAPAPDVFCPQVIEILRRYCRQNTLPEPSAAALEDLAGRLWALVRDRGLPAPLAPGERGQPGEIPESECDALVAQTLGPVAAETLATVAAPVRQLVKACFYPEFKTCRDSFREVSPDGSCRRQQLARVRTRVSGAHCVDCPYWVSLPEEQHVKFLTRSWQLAGRDEFAAHRRIFLPEDFRAFRRLLHAAARNRI